MKCIVKLLVILFIVSPVFAFCAVTLKAEGQIRTRIIAFTNENKIIDSVVKDRRNHKPVGTFNDTVVGINIAKQEVDIVNVAVTF